MLDIINQVISTYLSTNEDKYAGKLINKGHKLTGQSEPNTSSALLYNSDLNRYDPFRALSNPSFFVADSKSSNSCSGCEKQHEIRLWKRKTKTP